MHLSPDEKLVAVGSMKARIRVYELESGEEKCPEFKN